MSTSELHTVYYYMIIHKYMHDKNVNKIIKLGIKVFLCIYKMFVGQQRFLFASEIMKDTFIIIIVYAEFILVSLCRKL